MVAHAAIRKADRITEPFDMRHRQRGDGVPGVADDRGRDVHHALDHEAVDNLVPPDADRRQILLQLLPRHALRKRRARQHLGQGVFGLEGHHHPARRGAPDIDPRAKPHRHDMAGRRVHLPDDQHRLLGQNGKVHRLVDPLRQRPHHGCGGGGQPADQRRALRDLEHQGRQHIAVACRCQRRCSRVPAARPASGRFRRPNAPAPARSRPGSARHRTATDAQECRALFPGPGPCTSECVRPLPTRRILPMKSGMRKWADRPFPI